MTQYSNPKLSHQVNVTPVHPLRELTILSLGLIGLVAIVALIFAQLANWFAPRVPFSWELSWSSSITDFLPTEEKNSRQQYLQELVDEIAELQQLPDEMTIQVHFLESDEVNAFATLGGHVLITAAMWDLIENEIGLYTVLAHEVAHVKLRHPIQAAGRGVLVSVLLSSIFGAQNDGLNGLLWGAGSLTLLNFNREQEHAADAIALETVYRKYGYTNGAWELFEHLLEMEQQMPMAVPEFLSTHPDTVGRISELRKISQEKHWLSNNFNASLLKKLPEFAEDTED